MLTILSFGFGATFIMLGFLTAKVCRLIFIQKPEEGYKGASYIILAVILIVFMAMIWAGEGGHLR